MQYTKKQTQALRWLLLVALFLFIYRLTLSLNGLSGYTISGENTTTRIFLNQIPLLVFSISFWLAVAQATSEKLGALVALGITLLFFIYLIIQRLSAGYVPGSEATVWQSFSVSIIAYLAFGFLHFKNLRALYLLLILLAIRGLSLASSPHIFGNLLESLLRVVDLESLISPSISLDSGGRRTIPIIQQFGFALLLPFQYLIFCYLFDKIKEPGEKDWSLRTEVLSEKMSKTTYSMIYWSLRFSLFTIAVGVLSVLGRRIQSENYWSLLVEVPAILLGIYVAASFYRNFLSGYLVRLDRYPSWLYLFLNIPILHFFVWLYSLTLKDKSKVEAISQEEVLTIEEEEPPIIQKAEQLQKTFVNKDRNSVLRVLIVMVLGISIIIQFFNGRLAFSGAGGQAYMMVYAIVSIGLVLWFMNDKSAVYYLFIIHALILLIAVFAKMEAFLKPAVTASLVNLLVYYALFHFDQLRFKSPSPHSVEGQSDH